MVKEIRYGPSKLNKSFKQIGFNDNIVVENNGIAGDMLVTWIKNQLEVEMCDKILNTFM